MRPRNSGIGSSRRFCKRNMHRKALRPILSQSKSRSGSGQQFLHFSNILLSKRACLHTYPRHIKWLLRWHPVHISKTKCGWPSPMSISQYAHGSVYGSDDSDDSGSDGSFMVEKTRWRHKVRYNTERLSCHSLTRFLVKTTTFAATV